MLRTSKIVTVAQTLIYSAIGRLDGRVMFEVDRSLLALGIE